MVAGIVLAVLSYLFMGFTPLFALWCGLAIIGASMYLTPTESFGRREAILFIEYTLSNIARLVEAMGVRGTNLYKVFDGDVYIYLGSRLEEDLLREPPKTLIALDKDNEPVLVFKSPVSSRIIEGYNDICSAVDYLVVEMLDLADSVKCVDLDEQTVVDIKNPRTTSPIGLEKTIGSIYGIIVSSIVSLLGTCLLYTSPSPRDRG